jgi:hypothetical protein
MDISLEIVEKAQSLMHERTITNGAPAWGLTKLVVTKGKTLAKAHGLDVSRVEVALYLAHIVFSKERDSETMKHHMILSAQEAKEKLSEWGVDSQIAEHICKAIEMHHTPEDSGDAYIEVVKNAECSKFLTTQGIHIFIDDLKKRGLSADDIRTYAHYKIAQKYGYLTLAEARHEADTEMPLINKIIESEV